MPRAERRDLPKDQERGAAKEQREFREATEPVVEAAQAEQEPLAEEQAPLAQEQAVEQQAAQLVAPLDSTSLPELEFAEPGEEEGIASILGDDLDPAAASALFGAPVTPGRVAPDERLSAMEEWLPTLEEIARRQPMFGRLVAAVRASLAAKAEEEEMESFGAEVAQEFGVPALERVAQRLSGQQDFTGAGS